ncbi:MAG: tetratricopeptide repeat protein, partial [Bacteroidota bacterium]
MKFIIFALALIPCSLAFGQNSCDHLKSLLKEGDLGQAEQYVTQLEGQNSCDLLVAEFYLRKGRNNKAEEYFERVRITSEEKSLEMASALNGLGLVYWNTGITNKATQYLLQALSIRKERLGNEDEMVAASLNDLGLVLSRDDPDAALDYYESALDIYQKIYEPNDQRIAQSKTNIGAAYQNIEFYGDAQANYEEALAIWEKIYPDGHPNQGFLLLNLGKTNQTLQNLDAAVQYYEKALAIFEKYYGQKHPDVARANRFIGDIHNAEGKYDKALAYYQTALIANAENFNNKDTNTNPSISDYINSNVLLNCLYSKSEAFQGKFYNQTLKFRDLRLALNALQACDSLIDKARQLQTSESDK